MDDENISISLQAEIINYRKETKADRGTSLLSFWQIKKKLYERLYKLAALFFQVAVTEVDVERLFSHVHFILNYLRTRLGDEIFDDIMIVRMNFQHFEDGELRLFI